MYDVVGEGAVVGPVGAIVGAGVGVELFPSVMQLSHYKISKWSCYNNNNNNIQHNKRQSNSTTHNN